MRTETQWSPPRAVLASLVCEVSEVFLGAPVQAAAAAPRGVGGGCTAAVTISGKWHGTIFVTCERRLARAAMGEVLQVSPFGISESDTRDMVGEMTNVVAGNLKALISHALDETCFMSLPWYPTTAPQAAGGNSPELWFECEQGAFRVVLVAVGEPAKIAPETTFARSAP